MPVELGCRRVYLGAGFRGRGICECFILRVCASVSACLCASSSGFSRPMWARHVVVCVAH